MTLPFQSIKRRRRVKQIFLPLLFLPFFRDNSSDSWRNGANSAPAYASAIGFVRKSMEITQQKRLNHLFTKKHFLIKAIQQHLGFFQFGESFLLPPSPPCTPSSAGGVIARIANNNQKQPRHGLKCKIRPGHISLYFLPFLLRVVIIMALCGRPQRVAWLHRERGKKELGKGSQAHPPKEEEEVNE